MSYKILGKKRIGRVGRTNDFAIGRSGISLNKKHLGHEWLTLAINDDKFLCISFVQTEGSYRITRSKCGLYVRISNEIKGMFPMGSYSFTDKDGEWNISNCKANDEGDF